MDSVWLVLLAAGLVTGFSKFSIGGMGLLILPIVMIAFPGPVALGILIPMYIVTDILAVASYRKDIAWRVLFKFLPLGFIGVLFGGWIISDINAEDFKTLLGTIIVVIILLGVWLDYKPSTFMQHSIAAYFMGFWSGVISLIANAGGPLFSLFLIEQRLSKEAYVSTRAWAFFFINISKLPVLISLNLIDWEVTLLSMRCVPGLIIGAFIGHWLLKRLNLTQFKWVIRTMAAIAAIKLIFT